jgi:phenylalanyl-tRNA synthetase alpha chain
MEKIDTLKLEFQDAIKKVVTHHDLEQLRLLYAGKKGLFRRYFSQMKEVSSEDKLALARQLNEFKSYVESSLEHTLQVILENDLEKSISEEWTDLSLPGTVIEKGAAHPVTLIIRKCLSVMNLLGFEFIDGPEIETAFHNFDALNIPKYHPARDAQDTFWLENGLLLRSHTSTVQIRMLEKTRDLPLRIVSPGRVYRNESVDASHLACFHQFEGLLVDKGVKFSHLKATIEFITSSIFGEDWEFRIKPKHYPYTEPSIGVDIRQKQSGSHWITVLGAGMVHPNVLKFTGHDPMSVSGFAFGLGLSRMVAMAYQVTDMKSLYENDLRVHRALANKASV